MAARAVSEIIRAGIDALAVNQKVFAQRIGVDPATVTKWLNGSQLPNPKIVPLLADLFGIDTRDIDLAVAEDQRAENKQLRQDNKTLRKDYEALLARLESLADRFEAGAERLERLPTSGG